MAFLENNNLNFIYFFVTVMENVLKFDEITKPKKIMCQISRKFSIPGLKRSFSINSLIIYNRILRYSRLSLVQTFLSAKNPKLKKFHYVKFFPKSCNS